MDVTNQRSETTGAGFALALNAPSEVCLAGLRGESADTLIAD
jgi:hypothetical protein